MTSEDRFLQDDGKTSEDLHGTHGGLLLKTLICINMTDIKQDKMWYMWVIKQATGVSLIVSLTWE